ncbi:alpha/beta fold hydrolase [Streptomyces sp. NPDC057539]|uniref:alpha/beta hydrolase n=1 Tax=Streptomyces sp. NPDC057539 TaxID=3346159 RepID=UPI00369D02A9
MRPFVLVHGGRHGGWSWRPVARRLRARGHEVFTPTLTGLGERAHLLSPEIGLDTHVEDVVAVFEYEDLRDAVLVGHSYGGTVVSAALERVADRVRMQVLLDGHLPYTGETVLDLTGPRRSEAMTRLVDDKGEGWFVPPTDASQYGVTDPAAAAWVNERLTAQPFKTYQDPIGPTERAWQHPGMFVECVPSSLEPHLLERARRRSKEDGRFHYRVLHTPHDAMVTDPEGVTALLLEALELE